MFQFSNKFAMYNRIKRSWVIKVNLISIYSSANSKTPIKITLKKLDVGGFPVEKAMLMR